MRGELNVNSALYKYALLLDDVQEVDLMEMVERILLQIESEMDG